MKMTFFKKNLLKIGLILALVVSVFLCIYTTVSYKTNTNVIQYKNGQDNSFKGGENQWSNSTNQTLRVQNSSQYMDSSSEAMPPPNGNMSDIKGNMQEIDEGVTIKYADILMIYSAIFLILSIGSYYFFIYKKIQISPSNEKVLIFILLFIGLLLKIFTSTLVEEHNYINLFKNWATSSGSNLSESYTNSTPVDYPPLYIYISFLTGKVFNINMINPYFMLLLKFPSIIADITTTYFIYKLGKRYLSTEISLLLSGFYIFNPANFIDSAFWGQVDSFLVFFVVLAVFSLL